MWSMCKSSCGYERSSEVQQGQFRCRCSIKVQMKWPCTAQIMCVDFIGCIWGWKTRTWQISFGSEPSAIHQRGCDGRWELLDHKKCCGWELACMDEGLMNQNKSESIINTHSLCVQKTNCTLTRRYADGPLGGSSVQGVLPFFSPLTLPECEANRWPFITSAASFCVVIVVIRRVPGFVITLAVVSVDQRQEEHAVCVCSESVLIKQTPSLTLVLELCTTCGPWWDLYFYF